MFQPVELFDDNIVFDEKQTVFLVRTGPVEIPTRGDGVFVEGTEDWLLDFVGDGHVVLDGVQPPQYEVKDTDLTDSKTSAVVNIRDADKVGNALAPVGGDGRRKN